ncbi:LysR substrate-binding domain-containing protein [Salinarimonas soli]|uniref:LysR family transcriptional regulator n=1 Tax=Salinarimonas soli TaxID=1638099 RepID=A0A5B2VYC7_9HYPH|nr:LysR substrate-binding domain-containing protein [Salinarimonas soli]KAA2244045.1 LysR family transcriptional regulator [Salinarimonas soli]
MNTPLPSLRQLAYLVALHEHQHFGRAAAACFVTQPTLSVGIAELEELLGVVLVERSKRSLRFTALGEDVAARARQLIRGAEDLCAAAHGAREPLVGPVRMAAIPTVAPFVLPRILGGMSRSWPQLRLLVREMLTGPACEGLQRGTLDCVLLALPAACGNVEAYDIAVDRLLLATSSGDAGPDTRASLDSIDAARLLVLEDGHCLRDHALTACKASRPAADAPLVASTLETLVRLVDAGLGVTLLPEMAVAAGVLAGSRVRSQAIEGDGVERRIALVWRRDHPRKAEFRLLGRSIRDVLDSAAG